MTEDIAKRTAENYNAIDIVGVRDLLKISRNNHMTKLYDWDGVPTQYNKIAYEYEVMEELLKLVEEALKILDNDEPFDESLTMEDASRGVLETFVSFLKSIPTHSSTHTKETVGEFNKHLVRKIYIAQQIENAESIIRQIDREAQEEDK